MPEYEMYWENREKSGILRIADIYLNRPHGPELIQNRAMSVGAERIILYDRGVLVREWVWVNGRWKARPVKKKKKTEPHPFGL